MNNEGFVYIIQSESGHYKIGKSTGDPSKRVRSLQTGSPFDLTLILKIKSSNCHRLEADIHDRFASKRIRGEWFTLSTDDLIWLSLAHSADPDCVIDDSWEGICESAIYDADVFEEYIESSVPLWGDL